MSDQEFDVFVEEARDEWDRKQSSLTKSFRLGKWEAFSYDTPSGKLEFTDKSGKVQVQASTIPLGSFSSKSNTWQWAWANKSTPPAIRKQAEPLKELFKLTGMDVFKMATIEIDEDMVWDLVAMCVSHLDAKGSYAMPPNAVGQLTVFVAIGEIQKSNRAKS